MGKFIKICLIVGVICVAVGILTSGTGIFKGGLTQLKEEILNGAYEMICLNDSDKLKNFSQIRYLLQTCFEKKYPIKSKYEK